MLPQSPALVIRPLPTGQRQCFDSLGKPVPCDGSGQDGERSFHLPSPQPRFSVSGELVSDSLTGLFWPENANMIGLPSTWIEALAKIQTLNSQQFLGFSDWRLPNRRELRSLISHGDKNPALPPQHPFRDVVLSWYWTSTSAAISPGYAWVIHLSGGRMFYTKKESDALFWPVRGQSLVIPRTGQTVCFDGLGKSIPCLKTGQDGETQTGVAWPEPRFTLLGDAILDRLTGLFWHRTISEIMSPWDQALADIASFSHASDRPWRLPTINELESLVDASTHSPALPRLHPFELSAEGLWSSTTSFFEPDWAYVLYLNKGAVGVGHKRLASFQCWTVADIPA